MIISRRAFCIDQVLTESKCKYNLIEYTFISILEKCSIYPDRPRCYSNGIYSLVCEVYGIRNNSNFWGSIFVSIYYYRCKEKKNSSAHNSNCFIPFVISNTVKITEIYWNYYIIYCHCLILPVISLLMRFFCLDSSKIFIYIYKKVVFVNEDK